MTDSTSQLVERLRTGDVRALARAISLVESGAESAGLLAACFPYAGRALRIGITGPPGAGKSTLVDQLARHYRQAGKTVGVLAVDPSSPFSGGAILGDRIRMNTFSADPGVYIRSMATRGTLGGLAHATAEAALVIEASGKQVILIETVGVGQDEIDIVRLADVTLVVLVPGMGDDVQSIKAGILEIADIFIINKSDREGVERLEAELQGMMTLGHGREPGWQVPIVKTVASTSEGTAEFAAAIEGFVTWLNQEGRLTARRTQQWRERISAMVRAELARQVERSGLGERELAALAARVASGDENPYLAIPDLMARLNKRTIEN